MEDIKLKGASVAIEKNPISHQYAWLDLIKAIALLGIFLNHVVEKIFGFPAIANPDAAWPPLSERLAQLRPLMQFGIWNAPINLLRWAGWFGEHGVELFLVVSGFGLTWGLMARYANQPLPIRDFYVRRAERIYPMWWGTHLLFMLCWLLTGWGLSMADPNTYLSAIGIRFTSRLLYYGTPAWWYVGLLLQLYLVYPLLWKALRRWGPWKLLIVGCGIAFVARALGSLIFKDYMEAWLRGAIFITRLPEFLFGMSLAAWIYRDPARAAVRLRAPSSLILAMAACLLSFPLALTLLGMSIVPFLLGAGLFILLYAVLSRIEYRKGRLVGLGTWIGRHSFSLYLIHHPIVLALIPSGQAVAFKRVLAGTLMVIILMVIGALLLEWVVKEVQELLRRWGRKYGMPRTALRVVTIILGVGILIISVDFAVLRLAPPEVLGWGERPSLQPDPSLGWRLKPSQTIRLQWESYDYTVTSNSLGFPGPEYPEQKKPNAIRIMTVGDAFTSAEGVNTDQSWPRLLERNLAQQIPGRSVEILNFGITAYGPIQYALLIDRYAPVYQPDVIIIGFFVNDYEDSLMNIKEVRDHIGFDLPSQDSWRAVASLVHLQKFIKVELREPFIELIRGKPRDHGYFLGNFLALERGRPDICVTGRQLAGKYLKEIKAVADKIGAEVLLAMIPAPVQVCSADQLAYYPRPVNLKDTTRFDPDQPQRMAKEIAISLGIPYYDLRPVLKSVAGGCPYQRKNMHWTIDGHRAVANFLAQVMIADSIIRFH